MKKVITMTVALLICSSVLGIGLSRWVELSGHKTQTGTWFKSAYSCKDLAETKCINRLSDMCDGYLTEKKAAGSIWETNRHGEYKCRASCSAYCNVVD